MPETDQYVGIDYGTTRSAIAFLKDGAGAPELLPISGENIGSRGIYSAVRLLAYEQESTSPWYDVNAIGWNARFRGEFDTTSKSQAIFRRAKLDIGQREFSSTIIMGNRSEPLFQLVKPVDVAALLIRCLKQKLEQKTSHLTSATISVPASWNPLQRQATKFAALVAGLEDVELIEEPVAALTYLWKQKLITPEDIADKKIMVIDFGGGTCDIAILQVPTGRRILPSLRGGLRFFQQSYHAQIKGVFGDPHLGGEVVDELLHQELWKRGVGTSRKLPSLDVGNLMIQVEEHKKELNNRLWQQVEAKLGVLSWKNQVYDDQVAFPGTEIYTSANEFHRWLLNVNRNELEGRPIILAFEDLLDRAVKYSGGNKQFQKVILVGGSSNLYFVPLIVAEMFPHLSWGSTIYRPANPETCVALGTAWHEELRQKNQRLFEPRLFHQIDFVADDQVREPLVAGDTSLPFPRWYHLSRGVGVPIKVGQETDTIEFTIERKGDRTDQAPIKKKMQTVNKSIPPDYLLFPKIRVSTDGIISININDPLRKVDLVSNDDYPLDGDKHKDAKKEIYLRLPRLNPEDGENICP